MRLSPPDAKGSPVSHPKEGSQPYPAAVSAWWLVAIFFLASVVNTIDRGILNLVVDPIRHDLGISDFQISLLQGLSFGLFYATVGVPLGLTADRVQRRWLIMAGVLLWSLATILGGLAPNFGWLFVSRVLVGLGEATLAPCAVSMISDMFPPEKRGRPLGAYLMGQAISNGLSVMLIGGILSAAPTGMFNALPGARGAAPWRIAFVVAGLLGFIVAGAASHPEGASSARRRLRAVRWPRAQEDPYVSLRRPSRLYPLLPRLRRNGDGVLWHDCVERGHADETLWTVARYGRP